MAFAAGDRAAGRGTRPALRLRARAAAVIAGQSRGRTRPSVTRTLSPLATSGSLPSVSTRNRPSSMRTMTSHVMLAVVASAPHLVDEPTWALPPPSGTDVTRPEGMLSVTEALGAETSLRIARTELTTPQSAQGPALGFVTICAWTSAGRATQARTATIVFIVCPGDGR